MKKAYTILKTFVWCLIGVFIGRSLYTVWDYKTHPLIYDIQSAPWYLSIEVNAVFTAVLVVIILVIMAILKKKIKKSEGEK